MFGRSSDLSKPRIVSFICTLGKKSFHLITKNKVVLLVGLIMKFALPGQVLKWV